LIERARAELAARLRERKGEIEEALLTRTYAIADPKEAADPEYEQGLRAAVSAALDYGLEVVEHGEQRAPRVPVLLLSQARLAARNGVPLDTVLRRYFAGYTLLGDFIVQEAGEIKLGEAGLKCLLRDQAAMFDRFLVTVSEEHAREAKTPLSTAQRQVERIECLLAGELIDTSDIPYDFEGWHLGVIALGPNAAARVRGLARALDLRLLLVNRGDSRTAWAWLGSRRRSDPSALENLAEASMGDGVLLAIGEPGEGLAGWRLTHRQASAALVVAQRGGACPVRYAEVALLAAALQDDLLAASLRQLYLEPLEGERDGGKALRGTLRAYLGGEGSLSSAASTLRVSRRTISNRLHKVEEAIGRPLHAALGDLETALRLEEIAAAGVNTPELSR
jgi:hypothetical protein